MASAVSRLGRPRRRLGRWLLALAAVAVALVFAGYLALDLLTKSPAPPRLSAIGAPERTPRWADGLWVGSGASLRVLGGWIVSGKLAARKIVDPVDLTALHEGGTVRKRLAGGASLTFGWQGGVLRVDERGDGSPLHLILRRAAP